MWNKDKGDSYSYNLIKKRSIPYKSAKTGFTRCISIIHIKKYMSIIICGLTINNTINYLNIWLYVISKLIIDLYHILWDFRWKIWSMHRQIFSKQIYMIRFHSSIKSFECWVFYAISKSIWSKWSNWREACVIKSE